MDRIKMAECCGSCLNTNKPKTPRAHAAHYEVSKTERWCFLHEINVIRETVCESYNGVNSASKKNLTRINNFNNRLAMIKFIVKYIGDEIIEAGNYHYKKDGNKLLYAFDRVIDRTTIWYYVSSKSSSSHKDIVEIYELILKKTPSCD